MHSLQSRNDRKPARHPSRRLPLALLPLTLAMTFACLSSAARGQNSSPEETVALVRDASWNEMHASNSSNQPFRYRLHKSDEKGSSTKEIVETRDGDVARLLELNDQPLTPDQQQKELARLSNLLAHPELQAHRRKREKEDSNRADEMVRLLPDAFLYTNLGIVPGPSGPAYRLSFKPNPAFIPPDREAELYHGMAGELWIDVAEKRMAKLDGHLISDVNFGWGMIGRLYQGGTILVVQKNVGMHHWEQTQLQLNLTGKILMVKDLIIKTTEAASDFHPVEKQMTYQDAIHLLQSQSPAGTQASLGTP
ncbi:MAG: hypothetical protein ACR2JE_16630 [Acidobacteriaceae bacterium]